MVYLLLMSYFKKKAIQEAAVITDAFFSVRCGGICTAQPVLQPLTLSLSHPLIHSLTECRCEYVCVGKKKIKDKTGLVGEALLI